MNIAGGEVGPGQPVFVVAEISCNHVGRLDLALRLIDAAAEAGADAVKFQAYTPDEMTVRSEHPAYRLTEGPWAGRTLWDLYTEAQTLREWFPALIERAKARGLIWFASVFGTESLAFLEGLGCPAYKIASAEVTDLELVRAVAATGRPVLLSDGMAADRRVLTAWDVMLESRPGYSCAWLRCVSDYPADPASYSLASGGDWSENWGLSDHTMTDTVAVAAGVLGACVVEKHLMLRVTEYGDGPASLPLDCGHSLTPPQFTAYVAAIRATEAMLRNTERKISGSQWRRRLVFARDLPAGHVIGPDNVRTARCGQGRGPGEDVKGLG